MSTLDSVRPTSSKATNRPNITISLTPISNVAPEKSNVAQNDDENKALMSTPVTPKNKKRLPKAKVSFECLLFLGHLDFV